MPSRTLTMGGLALALAACGSDKVTVIEAEDGEGRSVASASSDGDTSIHISADGEEAQVTIDGGDDVAVHLPEGFLLYPGAKAVSSTMMQQADGSGMLVIMESSASPDELMAYYRQQAEAAGIVIDTEMKTAGTMMIAGEGTDGRVFSFNASKNGKGSTGQLLVGRSDN